MPEIRQGHLYSHNGQRVLALASGLLLRVPVLKIDTQPWLERTTVNAHELTPMPMRYFNGEVQ